MEFIAVLPTKHIINDLERTVSSIPYASYVSWYEVVEAIFRTWVNDDYPAFLGYKDYLSDPSMIRMDINYELLQIGVSPYKTNMPTLDLIEFERNSSQYYEYAVPLMVDAIMCYYSALSRLWASYLEQYLNSLQATPELKDIFWGDMCISFNVT